MKKLRPCPICKGEAQLCESIDEIRGIEEYFIRCNCCGITTMKAQDKQYIIFCWENVPI